MVYLDIEDIISNAICYPVRLDSAGLTTFGTISGIFIAKNQDCIYEIREDSVLFEPSPFRLDAKMKCKTGTPCGNVCIPRGAKCRKGMMTPSAKNKVGFAKAALAAGVVAAAGAGAIAASRNKTPLTKEATTPLTKETATPPIPVTRPQKSLGRRIVNEAIGQTIESTSTVAGMAAGFEVGGRARASNDFASLLQSGGIGAGIGGAGANLAGRKLRKAAVEKLGGGIENKVGRYAVGSATNLGLAAAAGGALYVRGGQIIKEQKAEAEAIEAYANLSEEEHGELNSFMRREGIKIDPSVPMTPKQNEQIKQEIRRIAANKKKKSSNSRGSSDPIIPEVVTEPEPKNKKRKRADSSGIFAYRRNQYRKEA